MREAQPWAARGSPSDSKMLLLGSVGCLEPTIESESSQKLQMGRKAAQERPKAAEACKMREKEERA